MRKAWWIGGTVVLALAGVATAVAMVAKPGAAGKKDKDGKPEVTLEFAPREVVAPMWVAMPSVIEFSGPLVAPRTAVVRAKTDGTLLTLVVAEGSRVRAGQLLGTQDGANLASRLAERNALLESARAGVAQAERTHASNQRLADQQFISPIALDQSKSALDAARAQARAAAAQLDTMRLAARDTQIVAPIAGVVAKRHVVAGEKLSLEQQVLTLVDLGRLELAGSVGTHEVSQLSAGMPVKVSVDQVDLQAANPFDRRNIELARTDRRLDGLCAHRKRTVIGVTRIDDPESHGRRGRPVRLREPRGEGVRLRVQNEIDVALTIERHLFCAVFGHRGKPHRLE